MSLIGKAAPDFEGQAVMPDGEIKSIKLSDYKGKYLVLVFYPLDFTFVCPTEIISFSNAADAFKAENAEVVAVSIDSQFTHLAWTQTERKAGGLGKLNIPLLADLTRSISESYGVMLEGAGHTLRGTIVISDKGIVRAIHLHDPPVGRSVDETLRVVKAYQFTDKHGEVCPANWTPGASTIIPDPEKKRAYFEGANADGDAPAASDGSKGTPKKKKAKK